jgi:hypothetical protein
LRRACEAPAILERRVLVVQASDQQAVLLAAARVSRERPPELDERVWIFRKCCRVYRLKRLQG